MMYRRLAKMYINNDNERPIRVIVWTIPIPFTRFGFAIVRNGWNIDEY